jgi:hypothetical protein
VNGFSSTLVTVHGRRRIRVSRSACASFSPSSFTVFDSSWPLLSKSLPVATRWPPTFASVARTPSCRRATSLRDPSSSRPEREAFFFALDDHAHRHALHAARAESGLHFLPQHRRQRVAVERSRMRRLSCARTRFSSTSCASASAAFTASSVIS